MHLKNFSLIETAEGSGDYVLAPAYDLVPVNLIFPDDKEPFALPLNGKKSNIHRSDFLKFADKMAIPKKAAIKMIERLISLKAAFLNMTDASFLPAHLKERFATLIVERITALEP